MVQSRRLKAMSVLARPRKLVSYMAVLVLAILSFSGAAIAEQERTTVYLYTYHKKPPFIVDLTERKGMYFELAELLTEKSERYRFVTTYVPRKRLDLMLEKNELDGVVLGATPVWFDDKQRQKYLWLPPFFADADEFVSLKATPFEYQGDGSLMNKTMAGVAGYFYFAVNPAIKAGKLQRIDTVGEEEVLALIEKGRADMGIVSQSVFKYLRSKGLINDIFHFSSVKHEAFVRSAFTLNENPEVHNELKTLINEVLTDGSLSNLLADYQAPLVTQTP